MAICKRVIRINTKIKDFEEIKRMVAPIIDFGNDHGFHINIFESADDGGLYSECIVKGQTTAYCKGMAAEVKELLRQTFHCKLEDVFYAY